MIAFTACARFASAAHSCSVVSRHTPAAVSLSPTGTADAAAQVTSAAAARDITYNEPTEGCPRRKSEDTCVQQGGEGKVFWRNLRPV